MKSIRLLIDKPAAGARNMAVDEALARTMVASGLSGGETGFLRFYKWTPATLSFGYNQNIQRLLDPVEIKKSDFGFVRRMSGGKMVFHDDEWTFSLGIPREFLKKQGNRTFLEMFVASVKPIVSALQDLGLPARFSHSREIKSVASNSVHCYASAAGHSIFLGNKKLIGAAGVARDSYLLVHGSIPINVSFPPDNLFLKKGRIDDGVNMAGLAEFLDARQIENFPDTVSRKYSEEFKCTVIDSKLSAEEEAIAQSLFLMKYSDLNWKENCANAEIAEFS